MAKATQFAIVTMLLGGTAPLGAAASAPPMTSDSFLHSPAATVAELVQEVAADPVVQERLAHHFQVSRPAFCAYVHDRLVLKALDAPFPCHSFRVEAQGREYQVSVTLPAGTPVFAARDTGRPILIAASGDPLTSALSPVHSGGGGVGGVGASAVAAAASLGALGLFAHSGGSGGGSASAAQVASDPAPAAVVRSFAALGVSDTASPQVIFTQPLSGPVSAPASVAPISPALPASASLATPIGSLVPPAALPKGLAEPKGLMTVPEPEAALTFTLAAGLLAGLIWRRRNSVT